MAKIQNFKELAISEARKHILEIAEAGLEAIDTGRIIRENAYLSDDFFIVNDKKIPLKGVDKIFVVAVGKCAGTAAIELEKFLGEKLTGGIVLDTREYPELNKLESIKGTHPMPSLENKKASEKIVKLLKPLKENALVIFVISGGGSTLLHFPDDLDAEKESKILKLLFQAGANIQEINTIRKHISYARGGFLAEYAYPAQSVALIFSDVPTNDFQFIASGPTVKDATSVDEAEAILDKYDVLKKCDIKQFKLIETPKDDKYFENMENVLIVSVRTALEAMALHARRAGFAPRICTDCLTGEARDVGKKIIGELSKELKGSVLLYGGETTVTVKVKGVGGRNLELALSALGKIKKGEILAAIASDGRDNTDVAGALCDTMTLEKAKELGFDSKEYLKKNDSYKFFTEVGDAILTGETGSNVSDFIIALKHDS